MKIFYYIIIFIFYSCQLLSQPNITRFPLQDSLDDQRISSILSDGNNALLFFWLNNQNLSQARSTDNGLSWNFEKDIAWDHIPDYYYSISSARLSNGRILLVYPNDDLFLKYSDDNGFNWSDSILLPVGNSIIEGGIPTDFNLSQSSNGEVILLFSREYGLKITGIYNITSTDQGITWSAEDTISSFGRNGSFINTIGEEHLVVFEDEGIIYKSKHDQSMSAWSIPVPISFHPRMYQPELVSNSEGKIWLFFQLVESLFQGFFEQADIVFVTSTDGGVSWSSITPFTSYRGFDGGLSVTILHDKPLVSFYSERSFYAEAQNYQLYYGTAGESTENVPPKFFSVGYNFLYDKNQTSIRARVLDDTKIEEVKIFYRQGRGIYDTLRMYDDGLHNDQTEGDGVFGVFLPLIPESDSLIHYFYAEDDHGNFIYTKEKSIFLGYAPEKYFKIDINNILMSFHNRENIPGPINLTKQFEEGDFIYSGGFYLSGLTNNSLWVNGSALPGNYIQGQIGTYTSDPQNQFYIVTKSDSPFEYAWQEWKNAVKQGADFYDGDNDGLYNPVDLNSNGIWDLNEDKPDLIGDLTAWCVYNDGVPLSMRQFFSGVPPQGIEIQQTIFAYKSETSEALANTIFLRYRIINRGTAADRLDSVYFSISSDPDIGDCFDDLIGSDTNLKSMFAYNNGPDLNYGYNPPAFFTTLLEGPPVYISGETYSDNNFNGEYDEDSDLALDTAYIHKGELGLRVLPGAKNLDVTSSVQFKYSDPVIGEPKDHIQARNYMLGYDRQGRTADPCKWHLSEVRGEDDCSSLNHFFWYSGDPVTNTGWINSVPSDQRMMMNTGPFSLKKDEPVTILGAYTVGRSTDHLSSITAARKRVAKIHEFYLSNFTDFTVGVNEETISLVNDYRLYNNYPNPFNPSTVISFTVPKAVKVTLTIYDILGRKIRMLYEGEKEEGIHKVAFDASDLSTGIYFYELKAGKFRESKKMMLVK